MHTLEVSLALNITQLPVLQHQGAFALLLQITVANEPPAPARAEPLISSTIVDAGALFSRSCPVSINA